MRRTVVPRQVLVVASTVTACGASPALPLPDEIHAPRDAGPASLASARPFGDLLMSKDDCTAPPRATVTRAEALADVGVVERVLRRGWAGYDDAVRDRDLEAALAKLEARIGAMPETVDAEGLEGAIVDALHGLADSHVSFGAYSARGVAKRRTPGTHLVAFTADLVADRDGRLLSQEGTLVGCEGDPLRPTVTIDAAGRAAPALRPIVLAEKAPPGLSCRFVLPGVQGEVTRVVPLRRLALGQVPAAGDAVTIERSPAARIVARTFAPARRGELAALAGAGEGLRDVRSIVFDARANGGGSDEFAADLFAGLGSGVVAGARIDRLESEVTLQGRVNDFTCALAYGADESGVRALEAGRASAGKQLEARAGGAPFRGFVSEPSRARPGRAPEPFRAPFVLLVDHRCASACESLPPMVRALEGGVVIGENTSGTDAYGLVLPYRLPASGLAMTAGGHVRRDAALEGLGHLPDLWVDDADPVRVADAVAACLASPGCPLKGTFAAPRVPTQR
jgi:Peptidase family S41